jgi:chromosome segregation ATPase
MMAKKVYIERNRKGRDRVVIERGSSSSRSGVAELIEEAEQREASLTAENYTLRTRLSVAERDSWEFRNLTAEYQHLVNEHQQCRYLRTQLEAQVRETRMVEDELDNERDLVNKLKNKVNSMKKASRDSYSEKYKEKWQEVEVLKQGILERDELLRLAQTRIEDKNKIIHYLKKYLREHGFRVD